MYRKSHHDDELPEIGLYFEERLNPENRWVKMAERLPWQEFEADYARHFKSCGRGCVECSSGNGRIAHQRNPWVE